MKLRHSALTTALVAVIATVAAVKPPVVRQRASLSDDLARFEHTHSSRAVHVIVRGSQRELLAISRQDGIPIVRFLEGEAVFNATAAQIDELASEPAIHHLSGDLAVSDFTSVPNASMQDDKVIAGQPGGLLGLGGISGVDGQGVVVAVLDSGVYAHKALAGHILASVSMVDGSTPADGYGHGTHVAGIIAGQSLGVTPLYTGGIAPGAQIVNVKVLGDDGVGLTSDVVDGINWVINNKAKYNIRIMNLSLGHAISEPMALDPLCDAVMRAYQAGIVVVAAAGNAGKLPDGTPVLGGIASPGNSPFAITVGATNTFDTVSRDDDQVTTYSSRGPTRYDNIAKPDLAAPGNKIISLEAQNSWIPTTYPTEHIAGFGNNAYLRMSGTSMATPMISGAAALLLQAQPNLKPAQVKFLLQSGSTYMTQAGVLGAGAGNANFWTSRQTQANSSVVTSLLNLLLPQSGGASFNDFNGDLQQNLYNGTGIRLINLVELPGIILNPLQLVSGKLNLIGSTNPISLLIPKRILWGDISYWTTANQLTWGDQVYDPQGEQLTWGDNDTTDDYQLTWGDAMKDPLHAH
jgi:serine protease AprX